MSGGNFWATKPRDGKDFTWSPTQEFFVGEGCYFNEKVYDCLAHNIGNQPDTSPTYWKLLASAPGATWNTESEYDIGDIVWYTPNELWYSSKVDGNIGNAPTTGDASDPNWKVEGGLSGVIQDYDPIIGEVSEIAGSVSTSQIELTNTRQLVLRSSYPKYSAKVGNKWGGDATHAGIPAIQDVYGSKYDTGWIAVSDFSNYRVSVMHNLNTPIALLDTKISIKQTSTGIAYDIEGVNSSFTSTASYGYNLDEVDSNSFDFQSGSSGLIRINPTTGGIIGITAGFELKVVVTTKGYKELNPDMTPVIYVGNGSLSQVEDTNLDNRVTELENKLAVVEPPYKETITFSSNIEGSNTLITHNLNCPFGDLDIRVYLDNRYLLSSELANNAGFVGSYGYVPLATAGALNDFSLIIGTDGILMMGSSGAITILNNADGILDINVVVTKKASAPLLQTDFSPVKDWVEVWSGDQSPVPNQWGLGRYEIILGNWTGTSDMTLYLNVTNLDESVHTGNWSYDVNQRSGAYYDGTLKAFLADQGSGYTGTVHKISKLMDAVGQNRPMKAITDGWELVWTDWTNTTLATIPFSSFSKNGVGDYKVFLGNVSGETTGTKFESRLDIPNLAGGYKGTTSHSNGTGSLDQMHVEYIANSNAISSPFTGYFPQQIWKFIGTVNLNVNQTDRTIHGVPNTYTFKRDTTSGNVQMVPSDTWVPTDAVDAPLTYPSVNNPILKSGDLLVFYNSGLLTAGKLLKGLPRGYEQGADSAITFIYDGDNKDFIPQVPRMVRLFITGHGTTAPNNPVNWTNVIEDTHSGYNPSTKQYTVPMDGVYVLRTKVYANTNSDVSYRRDGSQDIDGAFMYAALPITSPGWGQESASIRCVKGQTLDVAPLGASSTAASTQGFFTIERTGN